MTALEDAARRFVTLDQELNEATGHRRNELTLASLAARHDLQLLVGVPCGCDEGTCEGLILGGALPEPEPVGALPHLVDELRGHIEHLEETNRSHLDEIRLLRLQVGEKNFAW